MKKFITKVFIHQVVVYGLNHHQKKFKLRSDGENISGQFFSRRPGALIAKTKNFDNST